MDPILDEKVLAAKWEEVQKDELKAIELRRKQAGLAPDPALDNQKPPSDLFGVALSGGGIRSACFNLGLLQALVQRGVMRYVDYLSTVSGGGYIGSFFSSVAHRRWRERELAKSPKSDVTAPAETASPLPVVPDPDTHKQPESVRELVANSRFLNDMPGFFNRYLVGTLLLNLTFFSAVLMVCTLLAYLWRVMDQQGVVNYFIYYSNSFLVEAVRPFFPAFMILVFLWLPAWLWSFIRHGTGAPARHSGIFLILLLISLVVGVAIWLGTPNMNFANVLSPNFDAKQHELSRWPSELIYPLAGMLALCLVPFVRPAELLKSGQQSDKPWKRWVFNIAGVALLVGSPFLVVYYVGRHNVSGVANRWDRNLVASDVLDWEDMLIRVTEENADKTTTRKRPGSELHAYIDREANSDLKKEIRNTVKMVKFNRRNFDTFLDYMTAESLKEKIVHEMNEAISHYKFTYDILKSQHLAGRDDPRDVKRVVSAANPFDSTAWDGDINDALKNFEDLIQRSEADKEKHRRLSMELAKIQEMLNAFSGRMSNLPMIEKLDKGMPELIKDDHERLKMSPADVDAVRARLQAVNDDANKAANKLRTEVDQKQKPLFFKQEELTNKFNELQNRLEQKWKQIEKAQTDAERKKLQEEYNQIKNEIEDLNQEIRGVTAQIQGMESGLKVQLQPIEKERLLKREAIYTEHPKLCDEWYRVFFPTGIQPKAAGHLLLRLFYPQDFREIQFVSRPLVITADQECRLWILAGSTLFFLFCGALIDFNYTSLHGYYQSRLQRAFLVRYPPEEDGAEHRDLPLAAMKNVEEGEPYHILSGAVETVHGRRLERRLTAFQFAQQYCGSMELGFAKTEEYCDGRMSLADAMSISGAAVNPMRVENLLVKILLVVTNFRLGQWLPHPVRGPARCFVPFFRIASALMQYRPTNQERFIFVFDGGFYENLGIDILLERRCRLIVASDVGADEKIELADLARLYRLCQDKGIRIINLENDNPITMECILDAVKKRNFAICRILYPGGGEGLLFHVKSFLVPPATLDLAQYKIMHDQFPHDATTNQFFDEVQFKCYQQLGWQIGQRVCEQLFPEEWHDKPIDIERLKEMLIEKKAPTPCPPPSATRVRTNYDA